MKKQHQFLYGILVSCFAIFGALFFSACEKEAPPVIEDPIIDDTEMLADSIEDLVGYFHSQQEVFFIAPEFIDLILEYMDAFPTTDGRFGFSEVNEEGIWMDYFFLVQPLPIPEIFLTATYLELELEEQGTDNGVRYKVYKNAECGKSQSAKTGDCTDLAEIDPDTEAASFKIRTEAHKKCKKSTNESNLCKEKLRPTGKIKYYSELRCTGDLVVEKDYKRYRCD